MRRNPSSGSYGIKRRTTANARSPNSPRSIPLKELLSSVNRGARTACIDCHVYSRPVQRQEKRPVRSVMKEVQSAKCRVQSEKRTRDSGWLRPVCALHSALCTLHSRRWHPELRCGRTGAEAHWQRVLCNGRVSWRIGWPNFVGSEFPIWSSSRSALSSVFGTAQRSLEAGCRAAQIIENRLTNRQSV